MSILSFFRKKQTLPAPAPAATTCMILSPRQEPPDDDTLRNALQRTFGPKASCGKYNGRGWKPKVPGAEQAVVAFFPAPVPDGKAEQAADDPLWPDGPAAAKHRSHAVVGCKVSQGGPIEAALLLTKMVRAMLDAFEATAVYWPDGVVTVSRRRFEIAAASATRELLPLELWCRFHVFRHDAEYGGLHTIGLRHFGAMEIEIERSSWRPRQLVDFARNVANYVLTSGAVIKDGDTIGNSAEQKIVVHHGRSKYGGESWDVYKIVAEDAERFVSAATGLALEKPSGWKFVPQADVSAEELQTLTEQKRKLPLVTMTRDGMPFPPQFQVTLISGNEILAGASARQILEQVVLPPLQAKYPSFTLESPIRELELSGHAAAEYVAVDVIKTDSFAMPQRVRAILAPRGKYFLLIDMIGPPYDRFDEDFTKIVSSITIDE